MGRETYTEPQCLYSRAIPLFHLLAVRTVQSLSACKVQLYLFSPYGPFGLYRASLPVQYSYTSTHPMGRTAFTEPQCLYSTAIPLLPLWAIRPVQSLSACTVQLYLFSPYGPYGLYRASVPVQGCTLHFNGEYRSEQYLFVAVLNILFHFHGKKIILTTEIKFLLRICVNFQLNVFFFSDRHSPIHFFRMLRSYIQSDSIMSPNPERFKRAILVPCMFTTTTAERWR